MKENFNKNHQLRLEVLYGYGKNVNTRLRRRPYSESYARKLWNRITSEMGIKISFYRGTRHSSATEAVNRVGMDKVQEFLGHTRSSMTRRYAKTNVEGLRSVLRKERAVNRIESEVKNESS